MFEWLQDGRTWNETFPNIGQVRAIAMVVIAFSVGGLMGFIGSLGALHDRKVGKTDSEQLPILLKLGNRFKRNSSRWHYLRIGLTWLVLALISMEGLVWLGEGATESKILLQFIVFLPGVVGFFFVLLGMEYLWPKLWNRYANQQGADLNNKG